MHSWPASTSVRAFSAPSSDEVGAAAGGDALDLRAQVGIELVDPLQRLLAQGGDVRP